MRTETLREPGPSGCRAVLLPGRWDRMSAFRKNGFAERAEAAGVDLGLTVAYAHLGYYQAETVDTRLAEDVFAPLLEESDRPLWMVGTSLGGVGSIIYRREHPEQVAGIVLIAPFLGEPGKEGGALEEIEAAGSLDAWRPELPVASDDLERRIWLALQGILASDTPVILAYGTDDDLAPGAELLARELPPERVFRRPGGHEWPIWRELWSDVLRGRGAQASGELCRPPV